MKRPTEGTSTAHALAAARPALRPRTVCRKTRPVTCRGDRGLYGPRADRSLGAKTPLYAPDSACRAAAQRRSEPSERLVNVTRNGWFRRCPAGRTRIGAAAHDRRPSGSARRSPRRPGPGASRARARARGRAGRGGGGARAAQLVRGGRAARGACGHAVDAAAVRGDLSLLRRLATRRARPTRRWSAISTAT